MATRKRSRRDTVREAKEMLQAVLPIARHDDRVYNDDNEYDEELDKEIVHQIERIADFLNTGKVWYST